MIWIDYVQRWPHSFGQVSEIFKWNVRGNHAADLIASKASKASKASEAFGAFEVFEVLEALEASDRFVAI
ncbi:hypothetical protein [Burkholderia savannae]|uniref:hypothetical protein n=1 Tax=Burkholderia savannae TaxID=1637837 RepID=UPI000AC001E6|nr:hypothetical protein [Burkholderia savannae]